MWLLSNKVKVKDSGLLEGFCDYHCHLLPGVDDGVQEMQECLAILGLWEKVGVKEIWLTPHIMEDIPNISSDLKMRFEKVKTVFTGEIKLHLAAENMMDHLFMKRLATRDLLPIGKAETHLLIETSYYTPPMDMERMIGCVMEYGYTPILAHPERYLYMNTEDYGKWKQKGVWLQLNIPSLIGAYGQEVQRRAERLLGKRMYDCCGTDTHTLVFAENYLNSIIQKKTVMAIRQIIDKQFI